MRSRWSGIRTPVSGSVSPQRAGIAMGGPFAATVVPREYARALGGRARQRPRVQLAQPVRRLLVSGRVCRHPGAEALPQPQVRVVELEQAHFGVQEALGEVLRAGNLVPLPQLG